MKNQINWRSNASEIALFFQMIGETPTIKYFITKMKGEDNFTLKFDKRIFYFSSIEEAQFWCETDFNQ